MTSLSARLLSLLQLTRMALVFTAIADTLCALLLRVRMELPAGQAVLTHLDWRQVVAVVGMSVGLYGYGMSLNDIIDRRRDERLAAHRPLPSGRVGIISAHVVCTIMGLIAIAGGLTYMLLGVRSGWVSLVLVVWTALLITFYDVMGKYLVWPGLLTLGLVRFFHAVIPAPQLPLIWQPLALLDHVAIVSTVAYAWEQKRPVLRRRHGWAVVAGLGAINLLFIAIVWLRRHARVAYASFAQIMGIRGELALPLAAGGAFVLLAWWIYRTSPSPRQAGSRLMLFGLLWLIVYDAAFAASYVSLTAGALLLMLLPVSYLSVHVMRWWARLVSLTREPQFRRA